jgi:glycosyl transferase family 25
MHLSSGATSFRSNEPMMPDIPVYVISLATARERRALITTHLERLHIPYTLVDAVEGNKLGQSYKDQVNPDGNMSPASLGCYLSHVRLYEHVVANDIPVALILEDDTVVHPSLGAFLKSGCQSLDFDYCLLGSWDRGDQGFVFYDANSGVEIGDGLNAYRLSTGPYCLNAYLISLEGARKRVACAFPARTAIDHYRFLPYQPRFRAILPMLAFLNEQAAIESVASLTWESWQSKLHRYWWFYPLRSFVQFDYFRKQIARAKGDFPDSGNWCIFPSAFRVARPNRLDP